jgi:hypothetical protein
MESKEIEEHFNDHNKWILELKVEYNKLVRKERLEHSPISSERNANKIWETKEMPPLAKRQNAMVNLK